jgi:hypothetical protein
MREEHQFELALERNERILENLGSGILNGQAVAFEGVEHDEFAAVMGDLHASIVELQQPASVAQVVAFVDRLIRSCTRVQDVPKQYDAYGEELTRMLVRLKVSSGILQAVQAAMFSRSDGKGPPSPHTIRLEVERAQYRIEQLSKRINDIRW